MPYKIDRIKPLSNRRRYEYWREHGVSFPNADGSVEVLNKADLDAYTDEQIWRAAHPGEEPIVEVSNNGLPAQRESSGGNPVRRVRKKAGRKSPEG